MSGEKGTVHFQASSPTRTEEMQQMSKSLAVESGKSPLWTMEDFEGYKGGDEGLIYMEGAGTIYDSAEDISQSMGSPDPEGKRKRKKAKSKKAQDEEFGEEFLSKFKK